MPFPQIINILTNLTWDDHVDYVRHKINQKLYYVFCADKVLPTTVLPLKVLGICSSTLFLPLFDYADVIWGDRDNTTLMAELQVTLQ